MKIAKYLLALIVFFGVLECLLNYFNYPYVPKGNLYTESERQNLIKNYESSLKDYNYIPRSSFYQRTEEYSIEYRMDENGYIGYSNEQKEKIICIGDSFCFGVGVDPTKTFASFLHAYNAGLTATSFPNHAGAYKKIGRKIAHSKAIWVVYPPHLISITKDGWTSNNLKIAREINFLAKSCEYINSFRIPLLIYFITGYGVNTTGYFDREYLLYFQNQELNNSLYRLREAAREIKKQADENHASISVLLVNSKLQFMLLENLRPLFPLKYRVTRLDALRPSFEIKKILHEEGIDNIIETFEVFDRNDIKSFFYAKDAHWNDKGHEIVGKYLKTK